MINEKSDRVCGVFSKVFAVFNGIGLVGATVGFLNVRGKYREIYSDLMDGTALPVVTGLLLSVPTLVCLFIALVLLVLLVAKEFLRPKWIPLVMNLVWFLFGVAMTVIGVAILMVPMTRIMQQLEAGQP